MIQTKLAETAEISIQCDLPTIQIVSSSPSMQIIPIPSTQNLERNSISFVPVSMSQTINSEPVQANDDPTRRKTLSPPDASNSLNSQRTLRSTSSLQASQSMVIVNVPSINNMNEAPINNCLYDQSTDTDAINVNTHNQIKPYQQIAMVRPQQRPLPLLLPIQIVKKQALLTHNHFEFLNYIDIKAVQIQLNISPKERILNLCDMKDGFLTKLNYNMPGRHRITLNGESTRKLLKLSDIEWSAIQDILNYIREFAFESTANEPVQESIFHRCLYYFFKTASRFSSAIVERFDDNDNNIYAYSSTIKLPKNVETDVKNVIDPYVLSQMRVEVKSAKHAGLHKN